MATTRKSSQGTTVLEMDVDAIRKREEAVQQESDASILARLSDRFDSLTDMTKAVRSGAVRAMIVSGPAGVGKSFNVENELQTAGLLDTIAGEKQRFEIVKGAISSVGLYVKLHEYHEEGNVIVFDDADNIFFEDTSLNLLKAALDTSTRRFINWNYDSRLLRSEGIPDRFEFKGAIIFITNINFAYVRSKKLKDHLNALQSRCHYIDLDMNTQREKILWIKQIVDEHDMLEKYNFEESARAELIDFIVEHKDRLRELSLRTVLKAADLKLAFPERWQPMARTTLMRNN